MESSHLMHQQGISFNAICSALTVFCRAASTSKATAKDAIRVETIMTRGDGWQLFVLLLEVALIVPMDKRTLRSPVLWECVRSAVLPAASRLFSLPPSSRTASDAEQIQDVRLPRCACPHSFFLRFLEEKPRKKERNIIIPHAHMPRSLGLLFF